LIFRTSILIARQEFVAKLENMVQKVELAVAEKGKAEAA
jgi:hypothetical protein